MFYYIASQKCPKYFTIPPSWERKQSGRSALFIGTVQQVLRIILLLVVTGLETFSEWWQDHLLALTPHSAVSNSAKRTGSDVIVTSVGTTRSHMLGTTDCVELSPAPGADVSENKANTRRAWQSQTWGRPVPQVRVQNQFRKTKFLSQWWQVAWKSLVRTLPISRKLWTLAR